MTSLDSRPVCWPEITVYCVLQKRLPPHSSAMTKPNPTFASFCKLLPGLLFFGSVALAQTPPGISRDEVVPTGQWLEARKALFTGAPILLHLRTGHERALLMPEPVRIADAEHQFSAYQVDIAGDTVRFYPLTHFDREPIHLTGLETGTAYTLQIRASAFGIRQPLQVFLTE